MGFGEGDKGGSRQGAVVAVNCPLVKSKAGKFGLGKVGFGVRWHGALFTAEWICS
jgi:hypothetical protein